MSRVVYVEAKNPRSAVTHKSLVLLLVRNITTTHKALAFSINRTVSVLPGVIGSNVDEKVGINLLSGHIVFHAIQEHRLSAKSLRRYTGREWRRSQTKKRCVIREKNCGMDHRPFL